MNGDIYVIRLGSVGTGWIAEEFIKGVKQVPELAYTACYSRKEETARCFAEKCGAEKVYTNLEEMAQSCDIDAVYIASPNSCHYAQSKLFLENGKHVICEKPITVAPQELEELQDLAKKKDLVYMEAIIGMHIPQRELFRETVSSLGKINMLRADYSKVSSKYQAYLNGENPNIFNPKMGTGGLMDMGIYCVYPVVYLFGMPQTVSASVVFLDTGADTSGSILFHYPNMTACLSYSKTTRAGFGSEIRGEKGTLLIPTISNFNNMSLLPLEGKANPICGKDDKFLQMSYEAKSFALFITDMTSHKKEYDMLTSLALQVSKVMEEIRKVGGIHLG